MNISRLRYTSFRGIKTNPTTQTAIITQKMIDIANKIPKIRFITFSHNILHNKMEVTTSLEKIKKSLRDGNLCIIPTDTILGIFSTSNHTAVTKIFHTKKRDLNKPLAIFLPNVEVIGKYGIETEESKAFTRQNLPGAYTILLKATEFAKAELSPLLISRDGKVGIRIPNQKDLLDIASGFVICGTSVNISGETFATNENISQEITDFVEYFYQDEQVLSQKPSTIIDFSSDERVVVR